MTQGPFHRHRRSRYPAVIGCDEVGRGALCGPVVVSAVWFDPMDFRDMGQLDDSKRLTAKVRERLAEAILSRARVSIASASAAVIDRRGIRTATLEAMTRAVQGLAVDAPVRIDGIDLPPGMPLDTLAIVQGDRKVPQIAAASIVAKVTRDRILRGLAPRYPDFGWEHNKGYGTEMHLEALRRVGPTPHHRRSFAPMAEQLDLQIQTEGRPADSHATLGTSGPDPHKKGRLRS